MKKCITLGIRWGVRVPLTRIRVVNSSLIVKHVVLLLSAVHTFQHHCILSMKNICPAYLVADLEMVDHVLTTIRCGLCPWLFGLLFFFAINSNSIWTTLSQPVSMIASYNHSLDFLIMSSPVRNSLTIELFWISCSEVGYAHIQLEFQWLSKVQQQRKMWDSCDRYNGHVPAFIIMLIKPFTSVLHLIIYHIRASSS